MNIKTGVQQYMLRDHFKTEMEALNTLKKIKNIGYDSIELCGFLMEPCELTKGTPLEVKEKFDWDKLVKEAGIDICSIHEIFELMLNDPEAYIKKAKSFGITLMVSAATMATDFREPESVKKLTKDLNSLGRIFKDAGITLLYHNHNMEFARVPSTENIGMDYILNGTDPDLVKSEFDAFWAQNAGADPTVWCEKLKGRLFALHVNDCGVPNDGPGVSIRTAVGKELGTGNMELKKILNTAIGAGCKRAILEMHDNWINGDPFASMAVSYQFIKKL